MELQQVRYKQKIGYIVSGPYHTELGTIYEVLFNTTTPRIYPKNLEPNETVLFLKKSDLKGVVQ